MNNNVNRRSNSSKLVNWLTVWGFIFACIAFNMYFDNRHHRLEGNYYRKQYEAESQRADSLRRAANLLEQRLQEIETVSVKKTSAVQPNAQLKSLINSEL